MRPDMPRWTTRTPPPSRWTRMYLARRATRSMRRPSTRRRNPLGIGTLRSGRLRARPATRRPSMCSARPRQTVSTSGSSGIARPSFYGRQWRLGNQRAMFDHMIPAETSRASADTADFGYREVAPEEKSRLVRGIFDSVAGRYDLMNDLMSGGIHRLWKLDFVDRLNPRAGETVLDVAGGTGDIAFGIVERRGGSGRIVVCDIAQSMLNVGRDRAIDRGILDGIDWLCGDAERLPVADASIDAYTIAFGLRNVTHIDAALAEARRVLKPGGRFFCLEFSQIVLPALARLYDFYSFRIVPRIGALVTSDRG